MTSPCFDEDFYLKSQEDFDRMVAEMKGVAAAARSGPDESIRQVIHLFLSQSLCVESESVCRVRCLRLLQIERPNTLAFSSVFP